MKLMLKSNLCPGDLLTMTMAVKSLKDTFPHYEIKVNTPHPAIWENNPHLSNYTELPQKEIELHYPLINRSNTCSHCFAEGYLNDLANQLDIKLNLTTNKPCLYLSQKEKGWINQVQEMTGKKTLFWLVCAGIKSDFTCKYYPHYQKIVDSVPVQWVQIGHQNKFHPPLKNVIDLRGKTNIRQLIRLTHHCSGGVGAVTALQHLCAAWNKPYMCILGGREPVTWVSNYPLQHTFHTIGMLPCCKNKACWKSRVIKLDDKKNSSLCEKPILGYDLPASMCMAMIEPEEICRVIRKYIS